MLAGLVVIPVARDVMSPTGPLQDQKDDEYGLSDMFNNLQKWGEL